MQTFIRLYYGLHTITNRISNTIFDFFCIFFQHRDTQETLAVLDRLDLDTEKPSDEELARKFGFEEDYYKGSISWWQNMKPQIWSLFDEPYSSNAAKVRTSHSIFCYSFFLHSICFNLNQEIAINLLFCMRRTFPQLLYYVIKNEKLHLCVCGAERVCGLFFFFETIG